MRTGLRWACLALLFLLIATPLAQIVMRSVFNVPMSGAEELARYFMICLVFLGAPLVTLWGGQIGMEEFQALIPARPRWWLQLRSSSPASRCSRWWRSPPRSPSATT